MQRLRSAPDPARDHLYRERNPQRPSLAGWFDGQLRPYRPPPPLRRPGSQGFRFLLSHISKEATDLNPPRQWLGLGRAVTFLRLRPRHHQSPVPRRLPGGLGLRPDGSIILPLLRAQCNPLRASIRSVQDGHDV